MPVIRVLFLKFPARRNPFCPQIARPRARVSVGAPAHARVICVRFISYFLKSIRILALLKKENFLLKVNQGQERKFITQPK